MSGLLSLTNQFLISRTTDGRILGGLISRSRWGLLWRAGWIEFIFCYFQNGSLKRAVFAQHCHLTALRAASHSQRKLPSASATPAKPHLFRPVDLRQLLGWTLKQRRDRTECQRNRWGLPIVDLKLPGHILD